MPFYSMNWNQHKVIYIWKFIIKQSTQYNFFFRLEIWLYTHKILETSYNTSSQGFSASSEPTSCQVFAISTTDEKILNSGESFLSGFQTSIDFPPRKLLYSTLPGSPGKSTRSAFGAAGGKLSSNKSWLGFCWKFGPNWHFWAKAFKVGTARAWKIANIPISQLNNCYQL